MKETLSGPAGPPGPPPPDTTPARLATIILLTVAAFFAAAWALATYGPDPYARTRPGGARPAGRSGPDPRAFKVISLRFEPQEEGDYVRILGEVRNEGEVAAIPHLAIDQYDAAGSLVDHKQFFTATFTNVPPGQAAAFEALVKKSVFAPERARLTVFDAFVK